MSRVTGTEPVQYLQEAIIEKPTVRSAEPLYLELEHFVSCIRGARPLFSASEAVAALAVALRIRDLAMASTVPLA